MQEVNGKNILFISPDFFGIDRAIIKILMDKGAKVVWFNERSVKSNFARAVNSIMPQIFDRYSEKYFKDNILRIKQRIDIVLIIKGEMITQKTIELIREKYPDAKILLYLYDSIKNIKGILNKISFYDRVISFDPEDCRKYQFEFRPLFCDVAITNKHKATQYQYDLCFYGTMYGDRFHIIDEIKKKCIEQNVRFYSFCYLRGKFMSIFYFLTNNGYRTLRTKNISFEAKSLDEISNIIESSKAVLDINSRKQKGLTIRTLETLISGKKLITTNRDIKNYDLYNENNVLIIDRDNLDEFSLPTDFINTPFINLDEHVKRKYTAEGWIEDVFRV